MKIVVGFSKSKALFPIFGFLIRKLLKTAYSHTYIKLYSSTYNEYFYYQASQGKVNFMCSQVFDITNEVIREFDLEVSQSTNIDIIKFAIQNTGKPYSFKQIFNIFCGIIGIPLKFKGNQDESYICSELISKILLSIAHIEGIEITKDLDLITPKDLYDCLIKLNGE